ncbi:MAG: helix-turn-helix domain-containing protein [Patescibacteria group bacterium]|nr:helix-turn-helix domain-containing protein [Patescibacteria group bacterium]
MSFVRKKVDAERGFGEDLKELRELRGWSLEQLARVTGMPISTIDALESEDLGRLRDPLYAERHVRVLVKALEGRTGFFMHKYRLLLEQRGLSDDQRPLTFFARVRRSALFVPSKYLLLLIPLPLVLILGWYVWHQASYLSARPPLEIISPADHSVIRDPSVNVNGMTDPTASVLVNGTPAVVESSGRFGLTLNIPRGMTKLSIVAERRYGGRSEATRYITYEPEYAPAILNQQDLRSVTSTTSTSGAAN